MSTPTPHILGQHTPLHLTQLGRRSPPSAGEGPVDYEHGDYEDGEEEEVVIQDPVVRGVGGAGVIVVAVAGRVGGGWDGGGE